MRNNQVKYQLFVLKSVLVLSALFFVPGCNKGVKQETLEEMISHAKAKVDAISAEGFKTRIDQGNTGFIIDCRQAEDYLAGHIPGALNIPRGKLEFSDKISDRHIEIFIYGYKNDCSALSAETLRKLKYNKVIQIQNGWDGWSTAYPDLVETGSGEPESNTEPFPVEESGGCG